MTKGLWTALTLVWPAVATGQVPSGVYRWSDLSPAPGAEIAVRPILEGRTPDLAWLRVRAVTMQPGAGVSIGTGAPEAETLVIVKDGRLDVTIPRERRTVGPGSVAVILPDDAYELANAEAVPVTYFEFAYQSTAPTDTARGQDAGGSFVVDWNDLVLRPTETGGRRQPFDRATAMFRRFEMHVTTLNPGLATHRPHAHRAEEMVLMIRGDATLTIDGQHAPASGGDLVYFASQAPHALDNTGGGPAEYFAFQWEP